MPLKQMIKSTDVEVAKARRTCRYSKEAIMKGAVCMVVYDGPRDRACYSKRIALEMIQLARKRLDTLEAELTKASPA